MRGEAPLEKWASLDKRVGENPRSLPALRDQMNRINEEMLRLLNERAQVAIEIGEIKRRTGQPIVDKEREQQIVTLMQKKNQGPVKDEQVARFFDSLFQIAKELQAERR